MSGKNLNNNKEDIKSFTVRLSSDNHLKLKIMSMRTGKNMQTIVNGLITSYLEENKEDLDRVLQGIEESRERIKNKS